MLACTGEGFLGKSAVWCPDPGEAGLLDVLGAWVEGAGPGGVELSGADMSGSGAVPQPRRAGSKRPTGPKDPRPLQGPGPPRGVSEETVQITPR